MMQTAILDFAKQFAFYPEIINHENLLRKRMTIVCGMGGSHLAADIVRDAFPLHRVFIHRDYGLPAWSEHDLAESLVIASSYSGNTEEVLDAYDTARQKGLPLAAIAVGGKLLEKAKADGVPFIQLPDTGIQPRSALGFGFVALLAMMGLEHELDQAHELASLLNPNSLEQAGRELAERLHGYVPIIYTAEANVAIAYNWKIKFNETGKIPAFYNVLPELNHNEMTGFDIADTTKALSEKMYVVCLQSINDHPRVIKRIDTIERLYSDRSLAFERIILSQSNYLELIFNALLLADWTAVALAERYGLESEQVPMVEEFKKIIAG